MKRSNYPNLNLKELLAIKTVAEYGSFNAAAITLNISQPVLTRTVQRVEQQIGVTLFNRNTRNVEITGAGKEFVALAERVLNDLKIYLEATQDSSAQQHGQVIISSVMSVACTILPRIVAGYKKDRPGVEIFVYEGVHGTVIENLRSGVADFGLTYIDDVPPLFNCKPLSTEALHAVLPKGHHLENRKRIPWKALQNEPLVSLPSDSRTRRMIDATAIACGFHLSHSVTVTQFTTMMRFVANGMGSAIVPEGALADALSIGLTTRPLYEPRVSRVLGIVTLKDRSLTTAAQGLIHQIEKEWKQLKSAPS